MLYLETNEEKELERARLPFFNYTGKEILPIKKFNQKIKEEINSQSKHWLNSDSCSSGWVSSSRPKNTIIYEDYVLHLKNVGAVTKTKLAAVGITKLNQLIFANSSQSEIKDQLTMISTISDLSISRPERMMASELWVLMIGFYI